MNTLHDIPLNLVTGFLGAGKTTLIRHLLSTRPPGERWAVLVNEFGELGIDGALLSGPAPDARADDAGGVVVTEVPGGCLCCANGVPFRVALNRLLQQARPARVLVEPTGLGHPLALLQVLEGPGFRGVVDVRATLCVVDPVAARDRRVGEGELFLQQLSSADVVVANHADRAAPADVAALAACLARAGVADAPRATVVRGAVDPALLDLPRRPRGWQLLAPPPDPGMRHDAACWPADRVFPHDDTLSLLLALPVARLKGVVHTDRGWLEVNATPALCETRFRDPSGDSRVEVIVAREAGLPPLKPVLDTLLPKPGG